jgi:alkylation response protein AidB-like acyl-CoA dehydrogenase
MLRASVRSFLEARAPIGSVRAAYDAATFDPTVWQGLVELGVVGLGMVDSAVVLEELGRAVCPAPFIAAAIGAAPYADDPTRVGAIAIDTQHVLDACAADLVYVVVDGEVRVTADFVAEPIASVDGSRKIGRVTLANTPTRRVDGPPIDRTLDRLGVALAVDGVGAAQRALELSVDYAKERVQFDQPIGAFQAVQHLCADMLRTVELGRAAAYYACWALDEAPAAEAHRAATLARAFAADAFPQLGATAIQVFGGVGFTWEHDIHLFYKRLLSCSLLLGTASEHFEELARLALLAHE